MPVHIALKGEGFQKLRPSILLFLSASRSFAWGTVCMKMKLSAVFSCMSHLTLTALISIKLAASYRPKGIRAATKGIRHYAWACRSESKILDGSSDGGISYTKLFFKGNPIFSVSILKLDAFFYSKFCLSSYIQGVSDYCVRRTIEVDR